MKNSKNAFSQLGEEGCSLLTQHIYIYTDIEKLIIYIWQVKWQTGCDVSFLSLSLYRGPSSDRRRTTKIENLKKKQKKRKKMKNPSFQSTWLKKDAPILLVNSDIDDISKLIILYDRSMFRFSLSLSLSLSSARHENQNQRVQKQEVVVIVGASAVVDASAVVMVCFMLHQCYTTTSTKHKPFSEN